MICVRSACRVWGRCVDVEREGAMRDWACWILWTRVGSGDGEVERRRSSSRDSMLAMLPESRRQKNLAKANEIDKRLRGDEQWSSDFAQVDGVHEAVDYFASSFQPPISQIPVF